MKPLLSCQGISKGFPGVQALRAINFELFPGEVHILLGENGAGKSTLMKILAGVYQPDEGTLQLDGQLLHIPNPRSAQIAGIGTIYQELNLIPDLSVAENIYFGREPSHLGLIDFVALNQQAENLLQQLDLKIPAQQLVRELSVAQQQMVEIAKALSLDARILSLDEPTSALSDSEIESLFRIIRQLRNKGVAMIYISHRFEELFQIGDRVTVMRDGETVVTTNMKDTTQESLIRWMVGRELTEIYPSHPIPRGSERLRVENISDGKYIRDISFSLYQGEILGIAGLMGAGRTELLRLIFGADRLKSGQLYLNGQPVSIRSPEQSVRQGIGLLTEDRKGQGLILEMSVRENISLPSLKKFVHWGMIAIEEETNTAQELSIRLNIKTPHLEQKVRNLSGGNQQKVVLAKWLATQVQILLFDEPTRGIDVGARVEVYELMQQLLEEGIAILMVSSDMPEILGMSDRILVMANGRLTAELSKQEATQEKIMQHATLGVAA